MASNPFFYRAQDGRRLQAINSEDRCEMVAEFSWAECRAALQVCCLQATVYQAIHRRLRELERQRLERAS